MTCRAVLPSVFLRETVKIEIKEERKPSSPLEPLIQLYQDICTKTYNESLKDGIPEPEHLKMAMQSFIDKNHQPKQSKQKPTLFSLANRFIRKDEEMATKITFVESLKCVFNHLWDEKEKRMISFNEYYRRNNQTWFAI